MMALIQLVYVSSLKDLSLESEIGSILESSVRRNFENGVTGMLLYIGGNFIQVLEGEAEAVDETFARICDDSRHHDVVELLREPIQERNFAEWSMGFKSLRRGDVCSNHKYVRFFKGSAVDEVIRAQPGIALDLLLQFSTDNR